MSVCMSMVAILLPTLVPVEVGEGLLTPAFVSIPERHFTFASFCVVLEYWKTPKWHNVI